MTRSPAPSAAVALQPAAQVDFPLTYFSASAAAGSPRVKSLCDEGWRFQLGDVVGAEAPSLDDGRWRELDLPHDWSVELPRRAEAPCYGAGGYFQNGIGWYRKAIAVDPAWAGQCVVLEFEGVYCNAEVFVNGQRAGGQRYGYIPFGIDLSEAAQAALLAGRSHIAIAVRVDNSLQPAARWFTGSGIYRHVWLHRFAPTHIAPAALKLTTIALGAGQATLRLEAEVVQRALHDNAAPLQLDFAVQAPDGSQAAAGSAAVELDTQGRAQVAADIAIAAPQAWSPASPSLYRVVAQLRAAASGALLDELTISTGLRTLEWSAERGLLLNGESIKLLGGNIHHDNGILGAAAFDRAEERKVELMQAAGFNAIRCAHNPHSPALLEACDRLGMLVIDEIFDVWKARKTDGDYHQFFDEDYARDVEAWLRRDWNHPSVICWSIGNELPERAKPEGLEITKKLAALVRSFDRTRPVTEGFCSDWNDPSLWLSLDPAMAQLDICGYNYELLIQEPAELGRLLHRKIELAPHHARDHERAPQRLMMATESFQMEAFTNWQLMRDHSYIVGDFVWTALDYLGEVRIGSSWLPGSNGGALNSWPWRGAYCGDIDLSGWRKPASHYRELVWHGAEPGSKKLYMVVHEPPPARPKVLGGAVSVFPPPVCGDAADAPSELPWQISTWGMPSTFPAWDWPQAEGQRLRVEVYSRYEAVRLYLNGERIGEAATGEAERFTARFTAPYARGELVAVGLQGGEERERFVLKTGGPAAALCATVDRRELAADGQDLAFVTIEAVDTDGQWQLWADQQVHAEVSGPGQLAGLGTGNVRDSLECYTAAQCTLFQGRALAAIRAGKSAGQITLRLRAAGLAAAELTLDVR